MYQLRNVAHGVNYSHPEARFAIEGFDGKEWHLLFMWRRGPESGIARAKSEAPGFALGRTLIDYRAVAI